MRCFLPGMYFAIRYTRNCLLLLLIFVYIMASNSLDKCVLQSDI